MLINLLAYKHLLELLPTDDRVSLHNLGPLHDFVFGFFKKLFLSALLLHLVLLILAFRFDALLLDQLDLFGCFDCNLTSGLFHL